MLHCWSISKFFSNRFFVVDLYRMIERERAMITCIPSIDNFLLFVSFSVGFCLINAVSVFPLFNYFHCIFSFLNVKYIEQVVVILLCIWEWTFCFSFSISHANVKKEHSTKFHIFGLHKKNVLLNHNRRFWQNKLTE